MRADKGHIGGALSCTDILVALFYGDVFAFKPDQTTGAVRDRFILSKGHSSVALYAILGDIGYFPQSELDTYGLPGSRFGGHPTRDIPGVEVDSGSLGQGLGIGAGLALSNKLDNNNAVTAVLLGDGECCEGSVWEAAMFAARHQLGNLLAIVDKNNQCVTDVLADCVQIDPLAEKWRAFGWETLTIDGHSLEALISAFKAFREKPSNQPTMLIADTVKGKGISFMEGVIKWHHSVPRGTQLEQARRELEVQMTTEGVDNHAV